MKIVLVNKYWYERGGTERVLFLTKRLLEELGHEVEIFGMKDKRNIFENEYFVESVEYDKMSFLQKAWAAKDIFRNAAAQKKFALLLQKFQPDIVHFHNIYHQLSFALVEETSRRKIPAVMTLHDYKMISPSYTLYHHGAVDTSCVGGKYYRCVLNNCMESLPESILASLEAYSRDSRGIAKKIDAFIAPSEFMKALCIGAGMQEKIEVISNPIEKESFDEYQEKEYVGYTGRLSQEKGVEYLIAAAAQTPEIHYKIAGTGPDEARLKTLAKDLPNVQFVGWLDGENLFRFISEARLLAVPSVWYENYPYSILRPQQLRKVVVGSDIGGIPELLPENCLFEPKNIADMVERIRFWYMAPATERAELGRLFQERVETENNPQIYIDRLINLYRVYARAK